MSDVNLQSYLATVEWNGWNTDTAALAPNPDRYALAPAPDVEYHDRALIDYHWHPDGGQQQHRIFAWLQGNETTIVHEIVNTAGQVAATVTTPMPRVNGLPMKIDRLNISQSGAKMVYAVAAHEVSSSPSRLVWGGTFVVENICVPYPGGMQPRGMDVPTALIGQGGGGQPQEAIDYGRIRQEAQAGAAVEVNRLIALFGEGGIRQALEDKLKDALGEALTADPAQDERARAYQDALFAFMRNLVGQVLVKNLIVYGVIPPSAVPTTGEHAWPRGLPGWPWGR